MPRPVAIALAAIIIIAAGSASSGSPGFVENRGQVADEVRFAASRGAVDVYLTATAIVLDRPLGDPQAPPRDALRLRFLDADPGVRVSGRGELQTRRHYFRGNDPAGWIRDAREYAAVVYHDLWPDIDLVVSLDARGLRYRAEARSGADLSRVRLSAVGAPAIRQHAGGDEVIVAAPGEIRHARSAAGSGGTLWWRPAAVSPALDDPAGLVWSTFLGGAGGEKALAVRITPEGDLVVSGRTSSTDFPTTEGSYDQDNAGNNDVVVAKLTADGTELLWATLIGGSEYDVGGGLAVAPGGEVVVTGNTSSPDFPTTSGALTTVHQGLRDGWVARLSPTGSALEWSTFLGGSGIEEAVAVVLDTGGGAVVTGNTMSLDFPTTAGAFSTFPNGEWDVFVSRVAPDGATLTWSTLVGGSGSDTVYGLTLDAGDRPLVTGGTASANYPVTDGALDTTHGGGLDVFVTALASGGGALAWSTFLGDLEDETGRGVVLDGAGRPLVCGMTASAAFPTTPDAYATAFQGASDAFVAGLEADGTGLRWSTLLGGTDRDGAHALAAVAGGGVVVTGNTRSPDFPTTPTAFAEIWAGGLDIFVSEFGPGGTTLARSTYLGGPQREDVYAIVVDGQGRAVIAGHADSPEFPTTPGVIDEDHGGESDIVVCALPLAGGGPPIGAADVAMPSLRLRNHPNPFNPTTEIRFALASTLPVELAIYDVGGRLVRRLVCGEVMAAGEHGVRWNGRDGRGSTAPAGVYFSRLVAGNETRMHKMCLLE